MILSQVQIEGKVLERISISNKLPVITYRLLDKKGKIKSPVDGFKANINI